MFTEIIIYMQKLVNTLSIRSKNFFRQNFEILFFLSPAPTKTKKKTTKKKKKTKKNNKKKKQKKKKKTKNKKKQQKKRTDLDISCKLMPSKIVCIKGQTLFSEKK